MLLQMLGFILALLVVDGLGTLVAIGDPINARLAPYIGFTSLFAGFTTGPGSPCSVNVNFRLVASENKRHLVAERLFALFVTTRKCSRLLR